MQNIRPIRLKIETINLLDKIAEMKIKQAIENKTFDIKALVKNKRGISYDNEIRYLAKFYLIRLNFLKKVKNEGKKYWEKTEIIKHLNNSNKINKIA